MQLSDHDKRRFIQDGFLHLKRVVSPAQVAELLHVTDHFYATNQYTLHDSNKDILPHFPLSCEQHPLLCSLPRHTPILSLCEQLLGAGNVVLPARTQIAYRPFDDRLAKRGLQLADPICSHWYHVDGGDGKYARTASPFTLLVGVCLSAGQTVDENRGQLNVWPASHVTLHQVLKQRIQAGLITGRNLFGVGKEKPDIGPAKRVLMDAGDVVLAHHRLGHSGGVNLHPHVRKNLYYRVTHKHHDQLLHAVWSASLWTEYNGLHHLVQQ